VRHDAEHIVARSSGQLLRSMQTGIFDEKSTLSAHFFREVHVSRVVRARHRRNDEHAVTTLAHEQRYAQYTSRLSREYGVKVLRTRRNQLVHFRRDPLDHRLSHRENAPHRMFGRWIEGRVHHDVRAPCFRRITGRSRHRPHPIVDVQSEKQGIVGEGPNRHVDQLA
jgi:hypothetical protein